MSRGQSLVRQWNLVKTLQSYRFGLSIEELAERLECSTRTVHRDLRVLEQSMFPIHYEVRDFGKRYWTLTGGFVEREELKLSVTEMLSLFLCRRLMAPLSGTPFGAGLEGVLRKIRTLLPEEALDHFAELDESLLVRTVARHDYANSDGAIRRLNRGARERRAVRIRYRSASSGREIDSLFHPYGMVIFNTNLYAVGLLAECNEVRTLKIDRFEDVELTDETFDRPEDFSLEAHFEGSFGIIRSGACQRVTVRFTGWAATNVREHRWHPSQEIVSDDGRSVTARFEVCNTPEFVRWILGYAGHAVVRSPAAMVRCIRQELEAALAGYEQTAAHKPALASAN